MNLSEAYRQIVITIARAIGVDSAGLLAVIEVESNGIQGEVINGRLEPIIRYEGHYFDKLCNPSIRDAARKAGVSAKEAGEIKNPASQRDRWKLLLKAAQFDAAAAYQSVSYGVGQVMGAHWKVLGYTSVDALVAAARSGFQGQVDLMVRYIKSFGLIDELKALDFSGFARGYNGKNYRKYQYDTKMQAAYVRNGGSNGVDAVRSGTLRIGSIGAGVRDIQALLKSAGFNISVDGDFGISTKNAIIALQKKNGLIPDGIVGPKTQAVLNQYRDAIGREKPGAVKLFDNPTVQKAVAFGLGAPVTIQGAKQTVQGYVDQISPYSFLAPITDHLNTLVGILTITGIVSVGLVALYKWRESKKTYTGVRNDDAFVDTELDIDAPLVLPPST